MVVGNVKDFIWDITGELYVLTIVNQAIRKVMGIPTDYKK